jgi:hypothetical protein
MNGIWSKQPDCNSGLAKLLLLSLPIIINDGSGQIRWRDPDNGCSLTGSLAKLFQPASQLGLVPAGDTGTVPYSMCSESALYPGSTCDSRHGAGDETHLSMGAGGGMSTLGQ